MSNITILDGALGQELVHRHGAPATPYWSTSVMAENPDLVGELHADYLSAGAQIIATNSYALLPDRLAGSEYEDRLEKLLKTSAEQAVAARDTHGAGLVAGSLGPLGASYRTDFGHTLDDARRLYAPIIEVLDRHVDFFMAETVSSLDQVRNLVDVTAQFTEKDVWIALSVSDEDGTKLRSGEDLADAAELLTSNHIKAVLINCTRPEVVSDALTIIAGFGKPYGAYANGFTKISDGFLKDKPTVAALETRRDLGPDEYAEFAQTWVDAGATIIGGCCEVGPAHIAELSRRFG